MRLLIYSTIAFEHLIWADPSDRGVADVEECSRPDPAF